MRRIVLLPFAMVSLCWCQDPKTSGPITVKVEMPSPSFWMRLGELAIPTALGGSIALIGIGQTNKNNAATNTANRKYELERLDRQFHLEFKREILVRIAESLALSLGALKAWHEAHWHLECVFRGMPITVPR